MSAIPEYDRAHKLVHKAVREGLLERPEACTVCGKTPKRGLDGHHADYDQPLSVEWLCRTCHKRAHYPKPESEVLVAFTMPVELHDAVRRKCIDVGMTKRRFVELACRLLLQETETSNV